MDAARSIKAEPCFVEDFVAPDACVLKMLRSPHAHAYITRIDTSEAEGCLVLLPYLIIATAQMFITHLVVRLHPNLLLWIVVCWPEGPALR